VETALGLLGSATLPAGEGFQNSLCSFNGKLYLICGGGNVSEGPPRKSIYRSLDNGATWERITDLPGVARRYTDVIVFDNKIFVVGGYNDTLGINLRDIWYMTPDDKWHEFTPPLDFIGSHATASTDTFSSMDRRRNAKR